MAYPVVTLEDLKKLYTGFVLTDDALRFALDMAVMVVDEQVMTKCPGMISDDRYKRMVTLLAAHYSFSIQAGSPDVDVAIIRRKRLGDADESYAMPSDSLSMLESTRWGQMALMLDPCGGLTAIQNSSKLRATFEVVGCPSRRV